MTIKELELAMRRFRAGYSDMSAAERLNVAQLLIGTAHFYVNGLRAEMHESNVDASRRKAKSAETKVDPKPPVKPVRVAEPSKQKMPKYSGNHAPPARRR